MRTVLVIAAGIATIVGTVQVDAAPKSIWHKGSGVQGSCTASVKGEALMVGPCSGLGHGSSIFVSADRDGCSIELTKHGKRITGKIFAYRNSCGDLDGDVDLGVFQKDGPCWRAAQARVCIEPGRSRQKEGR